MSSTIATSSTTLLRSNASDQNFLWRSLWRPSRRLRITIPQRTICRRKDIFLNFCQKLCRNISNARRVGSPERSWWRIVLMLFFCFFMACVSGNKDPMLMALNEAFQKALENLKEPKITASELKKIQQQNIFLRKRIMLSTWGLLRSKCKYNCYFKLSRKIYIDDIIICNKNIIIITKYELLNRTYSTRVYACGTHLAQNPILALFWH